MPDFSVTLDFDVPALIPLRQKFQAEAQVSEGGKLIVVGAHSARQKGFLTRKLNNAVIFHVSSPERKDFLVLTYKGDDAIRDSRNSVIATLASMEAVRVLPPEDYDQALREALLAKAAQINPSLQ